MVKKVKKEVNHEAILSLEPTGLKSAKDKWHDMRSNKKVNRQARNRKRSY